MDKNSNLIMSNNIKSSGKKEWQEKNELNSLEGELAK